MGDKQESEKEKLSETPCDSVVEKEPYAETFPGKRSLARTQPPAELLDPETMEELLMWDEYRDW